MVNTLIEVLLSIERYDWRDCIYLQKSEKWTRESEALVFSMWALAEDEEPQAAVERDLVEIGTVKTVLSIVENRRQQAKMPDQEVTEDDLIEAMNFYFDNDAFIQIA